MEAAAGTTASGDDPGDGWPVLFRLLRLSQDTEDCITLLRQGQGQLEEIQLGWEGMILWRHSLMQEIPPRYQDEKSIKLIVDQFAKVDDLGVLIAQMTWTQIRNCLSPASNSDEAIKVVARIMEKDRNSPSSDTEQVLRSSIMQAHCTGVDGLLKFESLTERFYAELKLAIRSRYVETTRVLLGDSIIDSKSDDNNLRVHARGNGTLQSLLVDLKKAKTTLLQRLPWESELEEFLTTRYVNNFQKQMAKVRKLVANFSLADVFRAVNYLDQSFAVASSLDLAVLLKLTFDESDNILTAAYLDRINSQVVQDMIDFITHQISSTKNTLKGPRLLEVAQLCLTVLHQRANWQAEELEEIHKDVLGRLSSNGGRSAENTEKDLDTKPQSETSAEDHTLEHLCCVINDSNRIRNNCSFILTSCEDVLSIEDKSELSAFAAHIEGAFEDIASAATRVLREIIFQDLGRPLNLLFCSRWARGNLSPVLTIAATLDDFYGDFRQWLSVKESLGKLVICNCQHLVEEYVRRFFDRLPRTEEELSGKGQKSSEGKNDQLMLEHRDMKFVPDRVRRDVTIMQDHLRKAERQFELELPANESDGLFLVLEDISRFLTEDIDANFFTQIGGYFGSSSVRVLRLLVDARPNTSSAQKQIFLEEVRSWETECPDVLQSRDRFHLLEPRKQVSKSNIVRSMRFAKKGFRKLRKSGLVKSMSKVF